MGSETLHDGRRRLAQRSKTLVFAVEPYDWRQSNFDTARELDRFVKSQPALSGAKFDVVAHSMGGIVTNIWALDEGGASRLHKDIYMGTPFQGSMNAFDTLSEARRL
jgi:pimeloyl-ACP methyl ester carboxylesterase